MSDTERMKRDVEGYTNTLDRMEPDIHHIDASAFYASAAISLKRIADVLERLPLDKPDRLGAFVARVVKIAQEELDDIPF